MKKILKQIFTPDVLTIFSTLQPDECRVVGGAVRDYVVGKLNSDIDIATTAEPETVMMRLQMAGIKVIPTGIEHGTVTAHLGSKNYEITTLRKDIETDGRHAKVTFTKSFKEDAERRDFTFNAMYLTPDGILTDFFGGEEDLEEKRIRFIGDPEERIREDFLRIFRFFRFYSMYGGGKIKPEVMDIFRRNAQFVGQLSIERITCEIFKILKTPHVEQAWSLMEKCGVLKPLNLKNADVEALQRFMVEFPFHKNPLTRLACLYHEKERTFVTQDARLNFSNKDKKFLKEVFRALKNPPHFEVPEHQTYRVGREVYSAALMIECARTANKETRETCLDYLEIVKNFTSPKFPLSGDDLKRRGFVAGPALGDMLSNIEEWWIENDFPSQKECLKQLGKLEDKVVGG